MPPRAVGLDAQGHARGKLSKMRKADLKRLVEESEPSMHPDSGRDENETDQHGSGARTKHGSGLTLDPDPRAQGGGHYFQSFRVIY